MKQHQLSIPKNDMDKFKSALNDIDWTDLLVIEDIENSCSMFSSTINIIYLYNRRMSHRPRQKNSLPWLNEALWKQMRDRDSSLKIALKSGLRSDWYSYTSLRNRVVRNIRKAKADFYIKVIDDAKGDGKLIWNNLNWERHSALRTGT